jgi:hypothetical protein
MSNETQIYDPNGLLDAVMEKHDLNNDAALARFFGVAAPVISKIRNFRLPVGASMILKCHEIGCMTLPEIRWFVGGRA